MSKDIKQFLEQELKKEEIAMMKEVVEDIEVQGLTAPDELGEALFAQIDAYEKSLENKEAEEHSRLTEEEKELIQLGMVYRRKRKFTKYWIVAAVLIMVLAIGTTSMGGPKKVIKTIVENVSKNKSRVEIDTDDGTVGKGQIAKEDEAYHQMKEKWDVEPVRLQYLPEGVGVGKFTLMEDIQMAQLEYYKGQEVKVLYQIFPGYSTGSISSGIQDDALEEYKKEVNGVVVTVKGYLVEDNTERRLVSFVYADVQYFVWIYDTNRAEVEQIVENLYFM